MVDDSARSSRAGRSDADLRLRVEDQVTRTPAFHSIGTIEGELEDLLIHGRKQFLLYDRLTGRRLVCHFDGSVAWEEIRDLLGKRIAVTGEICSWRSGARASIKVSSFYVFPRKEDLPSPDEVRGLMGNAK